MTVVNKVTNFVTNFLWHIQIVCCFQPKIFRLFSNINNDGETGTFYFKSNWVFFFILLLYFYC